MCHPILNKLVAGWQIDYAADCKSVSGRFDSGSSLHTLFCIVDSFVNYYIARVVKLVDTGDLKSPDFGRAGSSPALGTIIIFLLLLRSI